MARDIFTLEFLLLCSLAFYFAYSGIDKQTFVVKVWRLLLAVIFFAAAHVFGYFTLVFVFGL